MAKENEEDTREQLQKLLKELELKDEIVSAVAKTYQYISRIDIQRDYYEEIANHDREHIALRKCGRVSVGNEPSCRAFVADEYQEAFLRFTNIKTLPDRMEHEQVIEMEYRMRTGGWHNMCFIERHRDENGRLTNVLCAIRSISDEKKKEQELLYQMAEAKRDADLKNQFLSNMSHNIRTPLNAIKGMIDLAKSYPDDTVIQQKCRNQIEESLHSLESIVNNIMDMSKLESGESVNRKLPFNLVNVLRAANASKIRMAAARDIEYEIDWNRTKIRHMYLLGNQVYLERILDAIGENAVKFTNPGGKIQVWCKESKEENGYASYEFGCEDSGIGMSSEFIEHATDLFARENDLTQSEHDGAGLGLAIAKRLTESMGGLLKIESWKSVGTIVRIFLTFKIESDHSAAAPQSDAGKTIVGIHMLVAEDNQINMEITKSILEKHGAVVECAYDGREAVQRFSDSEDGYFDAILMDIRMPQMNGWDAARSIRALNRPDAQSVPIIAVSANAFSEDIVNSRLVGMNSHLSKPISEEKLLYELKRVLP